MKYCATLHNTNEEIRKHMEGEKQGEVNFGEGGKHTCRAK